MTASQIFESNSIAIFSSIFGVLGLNGLLLYFVIRHKVFIHFCAMVFSLAVHISLPLWDENYVNFIDNFSVITAISTVLGGLFFTQSFVGISREKYPVWSRLFSFLILVSALIIVSQLLNMMLLNSELIGDSLSYGAASTALLTLITSIAVCIALFKREKLARLYLYTNLPMIVASIIYVSLWFSQQGGLNPDIPYIGTIVFGGMASQMVLFSVFVGYKIKNAEKEKLILERNINQKLQQEVEIQTSSLKEAMEEVEEQKNELENLNELKNKLFTLVAHDLRNPMQNLSSLIELLEKNLLDPEKMVLFTQKTKAGLSESLMVMERLLHWSYKQLDGIHVQKEDVEIEKTLNDVKHELRSLTENKNIEITNALEVSHVSFDHDMLRVILRNLLSNGVKFSHEGGAIIVKSYMDGAEFCLSVEDHGVGMNPIWYDELVRTGKPAVKIGTKGEKGSGFGLLITKDFVEMNGGMLICESEEKVGTKFICKIPKE